MTQIDHVLLATTDLDRGQDQLWRAYGLECTAGGRHLRWGTANRIVPLGAQYLELVAVDDRDLAATSPLGRAVLAQAHSDRLQPIGLCLATDDLAAVASRLGRVPAAGSRTLADGSELRWTSVGVEEAFGRLQLPFFLTWENRSRHPGLAPAVHRTPARQIAFVEVGGSEQVLESHLGGAIHGVRPVGGAPGVRSLGLGLDDGSTLLLP